MIDYNVINVENTINSGQVFLWTKQKDLWYGINGQDILKVNNLGKVTSFSNKKYYFFRNDDNIVEIIKSIAKDKTTNRAIKKYYGLRLVRQDPFQCFISFIISSNSNIQKIKSSLEKISAKFGRTIHFDNNDFKVFPEPKKIANATLAEIRECGVGYRAKFVIEGAKMVESKQIEFEYLKKCSYRQAKEIILSVPGIGNKVADCILLFSLEKLEAFPLDRWMIRILEKYYLKKFELQTKSITENQYDILHEKIVKYFGPYAGYAQQFLFKMEREENQKKWL
jgi:N-glycosylase/DNA lyase